MSGAEQQAAASWVVPKSAADMPAKPGVERYEYVECLVLYKGDLLLRPWNCEHLVFDDEHQDDFFCEWSDVSAYRVITDERADARAAIAKARGAA